MTSAKVLIHYKSFHAKFDEWIPRKHDGRIQPYGRRKRLMNQSPNCSNKQPSTSTATTTTGSSHQWTIPNEHSHADDNRTRQLNQFSDKFAHYLSALQRYGLRVISVPGDGNCLFRAISHQVYGEDIFHNVVRAKCMDYMEADAGFFSQFVVGGLETFPQYLAAKRKLGCWGDDPEIQALCELYERPAEIWAYDSATGARKLRTFHEAAGGLAGRQPMRVSYYGGGHYDSIVEDGSASDPFALRHPAAKKLKLPPGDAEDACISRLLDRNTAISSQSAILNEREEKREIEDQLQRTEQAEIDLAIQSSRIDMEAWGDEDLETTLALSASANDMSSDNRKLPATTTTATASTITTTTTATTITTTTTATNTIDTNLLVQPLLSEHASTASSSPHPPSQQQDVSRGVEEAEIERELLATILAESLTQHSQEAKCREDALLEEANLRSLCDSMVDQSKDAILDEDLAIAIQLSRVQEEKEEVSAALRQSLTDKDPSRLAAGAGGEVVPPETGSGAAVAVADTEEEMLQLAINASLALEGSLGVSASASTYYPASDGNYIYSSSMYNDYDFESAEDLDLRLALEASLED